MSLRDRAITTAAKLADFSEDARKQIISSGLFEKIVGVMREPIAYSDVGDVLCASLMFVLNVCKTAPPTTVKELVDTHHIIRLLEAVTFGFSLQMKPSADFFFFFFLMLGSWSISQTLLWQRMQSKSIGFF